VVEGKRRNIITTSEANPKVLLLGHQDTVLPKEQTKEPFNPQIVDGKMSGLGSVDMKSGLAVMLDLAINHHTPGVGYVFSVDEEFDFKGAQKLTEITDLKPEWIINLEPTDFQIINGCRGITEFDFELIGKTAHAGRKTEGINAIETTVALVKEFEAMCQTTDKEGMTSSVNLAGLTGGLKTDANSAVKVMGNVVPDYVHAVVEIRIANPQITQDFVEKSLAMLAEKFGVKLENLKFKFYLGSMFTDKSLLGEFEQAIIDCGSKPEYADIGKTGFFELEIILEKWGGKGLAFGAAPADKCHTEDEYVETESVLNTKKVMLKFIEQVCK
jgi:acetylornithine deacetylase/succinyl-diaminopimelate desuccinylase-like protein